jgi:hypothetical protein
MSCENLKTTGYYSKPVIKQVPPVRQTIFNEFQKDIKQGKFARKDIPKFRNMVNEIGKFKNQDLKNEVIIDAEDFRRERLKS